MVRPPVPNSLNGSERIPYRWSESTQRRMLLCIRSGLPVGKLFMQVDRNPKSKTMTYFTNRLKKLATEYAGKVVITYADKKDFKYQLEHLNLQDEEHGFVIEDVAAGVQYKFESEEEDEEDAKKKAKALDVKGIGKLLEDFVEGRAQKYVKSQRAPKKQGPVKVVVGTNFDEIVNDSSKDILLEFYAPWCGHCKQLEPKYNQLGEKFKKNPDVTIAKIDATANDYDRSKWEVKGYPTIFFKPAGGSPKVFEGAREVDAMYEYIMKNGRKAKKGGKGAAKKAGKKSKKSRKSQDDDDE